MGETIIWIKIIEFLWTDIECNGVTILKGKGNQIRNFIKSTQSFMLTADAHMC